MAAIPVGAEFAVNTKTENSQIFPEITRLSNGGFVVAWHDSTDPITTSPFDIRIRLFDASGNPVAIGGDANDFIPSVGLAGSQVDPSVASLGENGFVVTWFDEDTSTIYARRFNNDGTAVDAVDRVVQDLSAPLEPRALSVAGKADGSFAVAWSNDGEPDVFFQIFDPAGTGDPTGTGSFRTTPVQANINPVDPNQSLPEIASMGDDFVVTWTSDEDVMGRVFAPNGSALSPTEIPIATGAAMQDQAAVTALPNGGFVTAWYQQETDQIMVGRFTAGGAPVGAPVPVNTAQTDSGAVDIAAFGNDYFVVTWTSVILDVMAQVFTLDATAGAIPLDGNVLVGQADGLQLTPSVTALDGARFAVSWADFPDPAPGDPVPDTDLGIRAQIFKVASAVVAVDDAFSGTEDTNLSIPIADLLANDTNDDADKLTVTSITYTGADATVTLKDNNTPANPSDDFVLIDPADNFAGNLTFKYTVKDEDNNESTATITVDFAPVNDAPAGTDKTVSTTEDIAYTFTAADFGFSDAVDIGVAVPAGNALLAVKIASLPTNGTLQLNGIDITAPAEIAIADIDAGDLTFLPADDASGTPYTSFTFQVRDNGGTDNGGIDTDPIANTLTINVSAVNDAAPVSKDDAYTAFEDGILGVGLPGVLVNDTDVDGDAMTAELVSDVSNGTLTFSANGGFTYQPDADFHGTDSFTYKANDGTAYGNIATVKITVTPENDGVPVSVSDSYSVNEDVTLTVAGPGVLANDTDVDGDPLSAVLVGDVSNGTLTLNKDGSFEYTPDADFNGTDSFTYKANDGTEDGNTVTVTLTVNPVNDGVPVSAADSYSVNEDATLTIAGPGVLANDTDADGDPLTSILVGDVSNGTLALNEDGSFEYTPDADFSGTDSFTYKANDGTGDGNTVTVTLTVNPVNDGVPVSAADSYSVNEDAKLTIAGPGVLANDTDIDGDPLSAVLVGDVSNGTLALNKNGSFEYTPDANFNGTDSFTYKANDGTADGNTVTVALIVNPVNDAAVGSPTAILPDGTRDQAYIVPATDLLEGFSDPDGDPLSVTNLTVSGGTVVDNGDGTFTITLPAGTTGKIDLAYQVSDGKEAIDATQTFTVRGGDDEYNEPPSGADNTVTTPEDTTYIFAAADFGFSDEDGDSFAGVHLSTLPTNGLLLLDGKAVTAAQTIDATMIEAGRLTFMPAQDANGGGYASFTFQVLDDGGASGDLDPTPNTLTIDVTAVNDAPVAADDLYATNRDTPLTVAIPGLLANDSDADGDTLTALLVTGPANGTLTLNPDGSFTYTPAAGYVGADSFTYRASDGAEPQGNVATVRLNVTTGTGGGGNQPAAFTGEVLGRVIEAGSTSPGIPTATGSLVVTDPDGPDTVQPIIAGTRSVWGYGTVEMTRDGMWTYTLDNANPTVDRLVTGETLTDRFVALAADGTQQMVTITITGADDGRTITGTPEPDTLVGTSDDDIIRGLAGRDTLTGGAGDDSIDGGRGLDTAVFSGGLAGYRLTRIDERTVEIVDIDPSDGDDGTDILSSIEMLRFGNADPVTIGSLAGQPDWTLERDDVGVTAATYQLFLHGVPAAGGFDYLVMSDVNNTDLNDPYYFIFNLENRYLNFASNLGTASPEGAAWFDTEYGALSYEQAVEKAFAAIVSADALRAIGADPAVALDFFRDGQDFFEAVAAERVVRPGVDLTEATKIVMLGSMLYEAVKANVGSYGQAVNDFADIVYASGTHEDLGGNLFTVT